MSDKRFDVDATPDVNEIDRTPAADRPNRIPSLNAVQWDNKKMVVGAALAGAIVFGVLSLVSGSGSDNKALEARKAPPPAAEAPYDPNSVIAPTLASATRDPNAPVQLTGEQVPAIGPDGQPITPYGSAGGQQGRGVSEAERRANEARELRDNARRSTLIAYKGSNPAEGEMTP